MRFIRCDAMDGADQVATHLKELLVSGKRVLWLISGGSNIAIEASIMQELPAELTTKLTIMLVDERFGPVGHKDSNMQLLLDAGFSPKRATCIPVLNGNVLDETTRHFAVAVEKAFSVHDIVVALLGMGTDGHTAGILPNSPATTVQAFVSTYQGPDFTRITLTFPALRRINTAYLFAYGDAKRDELRRLRDEEPTIVMQPVQIIKEIAEAYVYNDQLE